jgi:ketol-acid reductoisomerase
LLGGRRIIDQGVRERMSEVLAEVRAGRFAEELRREEALAYPRLEESRATGRAALIEKVFRRLRSRD